MSVHALDATTGSQLWKSDIQQYGQCVFTSQTLQATSDVVLVSTNNPGASTSDPDSGIVTALSASDVTTKWQHTIPDRADLELLAGDDEVVAHQRNESRYLDVLSLTDDSVIWHDEPPIAQGKLSIDYDTLYNMKYPLNNQPTILVARNLRDGSVIWSRPIDVPAVDGTLYIVGSDTLYVLRAAAGSEIWHHSLHNVSSAKKPGPDESLGSSRV